MTVTYIYDKEATKLEKLDGKLELGRKTSNNRRYSHEYQLVSPSSALKEG